MNSSSANQHDPHADIELRIRTIRTLWIALFGSIAGYFVLTIFVKPSEETTPNPTLSLVLLFVGISTTLISFLIKNKLLSRAVDQQQVALVQQAYVVGWAMSEVAALLGVVDYFVSGNRHYYLLLIISALGLLLQFPRRASVENAAFNKGL